MWSGQVAWQVEEGTPRGPGAAGRVMKGSMGPLCEKAGEGRRRQERGAAGGSVYEGKGGGGAGGTGGSGSRRGREAPGSGALGLGPRGPGRGGRGTGHGRGEGGQGPAPGWSGAAGSGFGQRPGRRPPHLGSGSRIFLLARAAGVALLFSMAIR